MMMFDEHGQVQQYSVILSKRSHEHLGQLRNISSLVSKINLSSANEISFIVYKYTDKERYLNAETNDEELRYSEPLWDEITDFKYIFIPELKEYYEIAVECNDEESLYKSVTGTSACECELAQSKIYGLEINSEIDIARTDYTTPTVFYDKLNPKSSLLHRVLSKLPQYSIEYVDTSLMKLQRTFSVDDEDVYSFLTNTVAEEIGCLFIFDSVKRSISVYDLKTVCLDCGHRGEFSDECPKCKSKNLKFFGKDTTIYIDTENLSSSITSSVDVDKVKNCFKLVAGDDAMTAAVKNCNPNGSSYIYYFSEDQKHEMPNELVEKIESYDKLVESYAEPYQKVMKDMYEAIDKIIYYTSGMMPERKNDETNAKKEASKLTESAMSPLGLSKLNQYTSLATVNSAMKSYAKVFIKSGYFKADPNESKFEYEGEDLEGVCYGYWYGNFKITNYSDEEDTAISPTVKIKVTDLYHTFLEQKIDKKLATTTDEEGSIYDVLKLKDLEKFKEALKLYCLNRLKSFYDAIQGAIDIMIEEDQANENADLYKELYVPYHDKLVACQDEMDKRNATIDEWEKTLDKIEAEQKRIQGILNFEKYLGEDMYKVFCTYKREDTYQNDNYISDGFENDEIFKRANEFIDAAKEELYKSGEHQRTVSGSLIDFMTMKEFAPLLDNFEIGNFIRIGTDEKIYRLRLVSYQISFDDMSNIDVEFSDVTKIKTGYSDLQSILDKTKSIASSYDAVAHQARSSKKQADVVKNWVQTGLDATLTKIVNNADNQNITMGDTGLLARRKDDFEDKYDDCQLKLLSTGLYVTDDSWRSVKTAIGKSYFTNPETGKQEMMYGVNAETLVGQMILGNQLGIYSSDGSSQMRFDNFGLVLNALDNGSGHYRRILDIQKDGVSQMYIDSDGNIVLATKQQIETTESIGRLNALYADIEKLYVSNATIEKLLAKYATIENLEAVKATIKDLDVGTLKADFAEIKKLIATDAEIGNLKADNVTIAGLLKANSAEIENLKSVKVSVGELEAYKITVNKLFSAYASIEYLESKYIDADTIKANYVKTAELDATVANINTLKANLAKVETLVAEKADIKDLNAVNANIDTINANLANINKLVAEKATIKDLTATNAKIDNLIANDIKAINATIDNIKANYVTTETLNAKVATINNLIAEKATIQDLNAAKADIGSLNAQVGNIGSILSGNIGTGTLQTIHLTAENLVVDEAVIKDLIASKIGVSDLKAGNISTDKFTIKSNDGGLQIVGSTQQFVDKSGNVRLQIGKDAKGNFSFIVVGEDGKTALYDQNGIKAEGIPDGLIVDKMVADNANIQASKVKYIDKDGNTTLQTVIDNQQGKINSLIKETTIDNGDGTTTSLKDSYNQTVQTVKGNTTTISDIKTSVNEVSGKVTKMDARVTKVEQTADKFTWIVKSGTNSTNFTLTDRTAQLVSDEINLKGLVKFSGLTSSTQKSLSEGKCLFPDLTFSIGTNNIEKYCNANTATYPNAVKVERIDRQSDTPTSSKHCMRVTLGTGSFTASCGFVQSVDLRANAVFVQRFIAKLPVGYEFVNAINLMGTGSNDEFISSTKGTGNYEEYVRVTKCGSKGTFNNGGYVYVRAINSSSATPTDNNPVVFYIASCTTYDITESSDYNAWGMDEIPDIDVTLINGGMIKTKSISTSQLNTHEILAQNGTFMNAINAQEINADRITSGKITSKRIDAYGLSILDKDRNIETFSIASDGQVTLRGSVESYDYISGKTGWSISYKGSAEFNDVTVRGGLITGDGGIASSGGLGVNLQKNTSFYNGLNDWTVSSSAWSVDKSVQYNGINSLKYSVSNLSVETISSCTTQAKSISAKSGDTFTAQAMFYTDNLSGITGTKPKFKIVFYNTAGTVLHEEAVTVSFVNKKWVLTKITATAPANTAYVGISFVGYLNGTFYISQPKIEKGNSATEWSLSPNDKGQVPRFWAGTTYENREYAPFIVYNDGSLKAAKGTFGGVFTGDIKIGNVSITDPNVSNGDDATITVINGNTGVKAVQLTDMSQSSFAQNISITDNFYNEQVRINQNGIVNALNQFVVGSIDGTGNERSILTKSYLQFKGGSIVSSDKRLTVERADNFDVGSVSNNTNLTVYGVGEFKKVLKITKELNFNDTVKCIVSDRGIDFNFYDNSQTRKKE